MVKVYFSNLWLSLLGNQIVKEDEVVDEIEGKIEFDSIQLENFVKSNLLKNLLEFYQ